MLKCRPQDIQRLKNGYKLFITQSLGRALKAEEILSDLKLAGLNDTIAAAACDVIVSRFEEVRSSLAGKTKKTKKTKNKKQKLNRCLFA
jgi:hypothetical protein